MIASISGILKKKSPTEILVDIHGIGFAVNIPLSTYEKLGEINQTVFLFTHLHIREDVMQLFGFATEDERLLFKLLISVSGIGPKIAQGILSGMSVHELRAHIVRSEINALTAIQGIGKKTAERLIIELRDKVDKTGLELAAGIDITSQSPEIRAEALLALISLGFTQQAAEKALRAALHEIGAQSELSVQELIKLALRHAGSR